VRTAGREKRIDKKYSFLFKCRYGKINPITGIIIEDIAKHEIMIANSSLFLEKDFKSYILAI
jgi:hypothetical protein